MQDLIGPDGQQHGKGKGSTGAGRDDGRYVGTDGFGLRLVREFVYRRLVFSLQARGACDGTVR